MSKQQFPPGWDEEQVKRLLEHYDDVSEEQQVAEDKQAAYEQAGQPLISMPDTLLPAIRTLPASHDNT